VIEPRRDPAKLKLSEKRAEGDNSHVLVTACDGEKRWVSVKTELALSDGVLLTVGDGIRLRVSVGDGDLLHELIGDGVLLIVVVGDGILLTVVVGDGILLTVPVGSGVLVRDPLPVGSPTA
jgi:hypothetical protein